MTRTILSVAYPLAPVGPDAVGGAEQVLTYLDAALTRNGHRSIVVACEGSVTTGTLVATPAISGLLTEEAAARMRREHARRIAWALERWPVDLVHLHGIDFHAYLPPPGAPALATLHLPPGWYPPEVFRLARPHTYLHGVSHAQQRAMPPCPALLPPIENGVPVQALHVGLRKRRYALALGRICGEKGFHHAAHAARRAEVPLCIAGELFRYEEHERYFREKLLPTLDAQRRYLGPVGFRRKRRLLSAARCLLVPSLAPETSSLVAMEALACGTPVIAFRSGALPEVVEHGKTGFVVDSAEEMAEAIRAADTIDPDLCRETARRRFSLEAMTGRYLELYERLCQAPAAAATGATEARDPEELACHAA
jgi:glycosyltransferase involved in cell wall biosynthesis